MTQAFIHFLNFISGIQSFVVNRPVDEQRLGYFQCGIDIRINFIAVAVETL